MIQWIKIHFIFGKPNIGEDKNGDDPKKSAPESYLSKFACRLKIA